MNMDLFTCFFSFLKILKWTNPGINPANIELKVKPKWIVAPKGLIITPTKSAAIPVSAPTLGPKNSPESNIGKVPKPILISGVIIKEKNLVRTIEIAVNVDAITKLLR